MKELTRIITAEITQIWKEPIYDDIDDIDKVVSMQDEIKGNIEACLQDQFNADDVHVKIQDFARKIEKE